jgi:hypothetical protein
MLDRCLAAISCLRRPDEAEVRILVVGNEEREESRPKSIA